MTLPIVSNSLVPFYFEKYTFYIIFLQNYHYLIYLYLAYLVSMRAVKCPDTILNAHGGASMLLVVSDPYHLNLIWCQIEE